MIRKPPKGKSLAEVIPELANEWHPTKNGELTPFDVSDRSNKKVWWKCDIGDDHEWTAIISSRSLGGGCSVCRGRTIVKSNCLATTHPEIAKQWHPTKNGKLTPNDVIAGSGKKYWWKCNKGDDHEWLVSIRNRKNNSKCPICSGHKAVYSNSLAMIYPEIAKEWHPTKNGELTPIDVTANSGKKVWWKCDKGDDHEWCTSVAGKRGCSVCDGKTVVPSNCLATTHPEIAKQWHPTKNGKLTPNDVIAGSGKKYWWKCDIGDDHEWLSSADNRSKGKGCPICSGHKVVLSNCLATTHPEIAKQWHPTKNEKLTPFDITIGSHKKVWWKCDKGGDHEWLSSVAHKFGCPICSGHKVVLSNCLATTHPKLAKQWHPTKNGKLTPNDVIAGSGKKYWWKCDIGDDHEWKTKLLNRAYGSGCPYCTLTPQSKQELTITFELIQFFKINPKGFKSRVQGKIMSIDIYISELNLGIEFDGNYWHKGNREFDKLKTQKLESKGFKIMRVREEPLKAITDIDVISKKPFNAKEVTNNILIHILEYYSLDTKTIKRINKYLLKEEIQNEKGLDAYIEIILTDKSEKKNGNNNNT